MPPPPRDPAAEWLDIDLTDLLNNSGEFKIAIDDYSTDVSGAQDIIFNDVGTLPLTLLEISKLGADDGEVDVIRLDLSTFDDDFTVVLKDVSVEDVIYFDGVHTVADNGDGTSTIQYYGSDALLHTVVVDPDVASFEIFYAPDGIVDGADGGEVMDVGYTDFQGDEIDGADGIDDAVFGNSGSDSITGGAGNDTIFGDFDVDIPAGLPTPDLPPNAFVGTPAGPAPGAEVDSVTLDDLAIDDGGKAEIIVEDFADPDNNNDVTINDGGTEDLLELVIDKGGNNDDPDVYRLDLSGFDDDFFLELKSVDTTDKVVLTNVYTIKDNLDGTHTVTYQGSDSNQHTITLKPSDAQIEAYLADDSPYFYNDTISGGAGDDVIDGGFGDDSIDAGDDNDSVEGGVGDDVILGGAGADTLEGGDGDDTIDGGTGADAILGDRLGPTQGLGDTLSYSYAQTIDGDEASHFGEQGLGTSNDPLLLIDGDVNTEVRYHQDDIIEYAFGQTVLAGTSITLTEPDTGAEDGIIRIYVSSASTDPAGDANSGTGGGVGYENAVTNGMSTLIYSGPSDSTINLTIPIDATHIQFVTEESHAGWGEMEFTALVNPLVPGDDVITGGEGDDTIDAGGGADSIDAGDDDDTIVAGAGQDTILGGAGTDTYDASASTSLTEEVVTVTVDAAGDGTAAKSGDGTTDTLTSVENYVADEVDGKIDTVTLTDTVVDRGTIAGLSDSSVGTFTPSNGDPVINFGGPGEPLLSELLALNNSGAVQIVSGDEGGQIGDIAFDNFETINFNVICFASGTQIECERGEMRVEEICKGDRVLTLDNGYQEVQWIGSRTLSEEELTLNPKLKPIRIRAGALGGGTPVRDLIVSPQHRMLIRSKIAVRMFDSAEVLIAAKHLLGMDGIEIATDIRGVTYWHFMFDRHEIVSANGAFAEALYPGPEALKSVSEGAREELLAIFPNADWSTSSEIPEPARPFVKARRARQLLERSQKNGKPLVSDKEQSVPA